MLIPYLNRAVVKAENQRQRKNRGWGARGERRGDRVAANKAFRRKQKQKQNDNRGDQNSAVQSLERISQ